MNIIEILIIVILLVVIVVLTLWVLRLKKEIKEHFLFEHELQYEAEHDSLTGLANGLLFIDRLSQSIKNASRFKKKIAILYLGLDNFTALNDSYGTAVGDSVLEELATKLKGTLRKSDTVARLGGDEFIIILDHFDNTTFIRSVVDKIMAISQSPFTIKENTIKISFSLGVSVYPDDHLDSKVILENASVAMHKVKENGRDGYQFYTREFADETATREKLEKELLASLDREQMQVHYQLQVNSKDVSIRGIEAVIRWNHPVLGLLLPERFLPLAREINFIHTLEDWVMQTSVQQFESWHAQGFHTGNLSLSLSSQRLKKSDFIRSIGELINKTPSTKEYLSFKLEEEHIMQDSQVFKPYLEKLSRFGIKLSLEKFGLGCSSVLALKELSFHEIQLDSSLLNNTEVSQALISMAKNIHIPLSATGIENKEQRDFFQEHDCFLLQGDFYHKASSAEVIHRILQSKADK